MNNSFEDGLKSKYWAKFKTIFNANILPQLSEIEKLRKRKIAQFFVICILLFAAAALFIFFLANINDKVQNTTAGFIIGFIFLIPFCLALTPWIYSLVSKSYARKTKDKIANLIAKTFNVSYKINSDSNYDKYDTLFRESELVNNFEFIEVDDLYEGNYEGIDYTFSDTRFKYTVRGGIATVYSGIALHIKTSKPFLGHTKILEKSGFAYNPGRMIFALIIFAILPILALALKEIFCFYLLVFSIIIILVDKFIAFIKTKLKSINISEKIINKNFVFTSSDKEEAKSFINKDFFEKLFELRKTYRTKSIRCAFFKDNIIIMIGTLKDIFEFGTLFKSAYNPESYKTYFKEIYPIFTLLHYLKNNSSISEYLN